MAESTEVIQHDLEQTRSSLAEKLAVLGDKISGTVENVEETVDNVTESATETVEAVKETVSDTVEAVKQTMSDTVQAVKDTFDLQKQMQERPWVILGGAVALGFIGGRLLANASSRPEHREPSWDSRQGGRYEGPAAYENVAESSPPQQAASPPASSQPTSSGPSWISMISEKFGSELATLKGLALGSMFGVVRDMVTQHLPETLKDEVGKVINQVTETVGGKTIDGPVFGESESQESSGQDQGHG